MKGTKAMNKITIIGNLTKNPELRSTQDGTPVCGFTVAVNRTKTKNNPDPGADFFNVNAWRGLGENCARYLEKGRKVCVVGRVSLRTWEKRTSTAQALKCLRKMWSFCQAATNTPQNRHPPLTPQAVWQWLNRMTCRSDDLPV
jgi:single stranded DNA-binding protein